MTQSNSFVQSHGSPRYSRQTQESVETLAHENSRPPENSRVAPSREATGREATGREATEQRHVLVAEQNLAKSLRERIGRENMTQSSTVATRRLDEALLRLDRAAGRRGAAGYESISSPAPQGEQFAREVSAEPRPFGSVQDVELDESIAESSALWLETEDHSHRLRVDTPVADANLGISAPHRRPARNDDHAPAVEEDSIDRSGLAEPNLESQTNSPIPRDESPSTNGPSQLDSTSALNDLFATPIDAMLVTNIAPVVSTATADGTKLSPPKQPATEPEEARAEPELDTMESEPSSVQNAATSPEVQDSIAPEKASDSTPVVKKPMKEFLAAWQVDEFEVPDVVEDLFLAGTVAEPLAQRMHAAHQQGLQTLAVTSSQDGEGRSTVAMGLALSIAFSGLKVALVDADLSAIPLAIDLNLELDNDWRDAVRGKTTLEEIAVASQADSVTLIPLLTLEAEPAPYVAELSSLLGELTQSFDLVIVDCPAGSLEMAGLCDTAIIVRDMQRTKAPELETYSMSLRRAGLNGVGVVENFG